MKLAEIIRKRKALLVGAGGIGLLAYLYFSPTPHFGRRIPLGLETPVSGNAQAFGSGSLALAPSECQAILASLRTARGGGPVHACPAYGAIVLEYANGDSKRLVLMSAHRFGRIDLAFEGRCYSMSADMLIDTLEETGIRPK